MPSCLVVASHFPPMRSAGVFRTIRVARFLPAHGWDLHVLTLDAKSYLAGTGTSEELLEKIPDGVTVHRTTAKHPLQWINSAKGWVRNGRSRAVSESSNPPAIRSNGSAPNSSPKTTSFVQRAKDSVTLPLMTPDRWIGWLPFAVRKGKQVLQSHRTDVIYSSGPPWTNHLVAARLKRTTSLPWVADFRDPWLGNNFRPQRQGDDWVGRRHQQLERSVMESAEVVVLNTMQSRASAISRYPELPEEKFLVIPNGFDPDDFVSFGQNSRPAREPAQESGDNQRRPLRLVHAGAFYGKRNVDSLLAAMGELVADGEIGRDDIMVELLGAARPGRTRESEVAQSYGVQEMVRLLAPVPHDECLNRLIEADVLLLVQTEAPLCIPGKIFEYVAMRKPIFTLAGPGATTELVASEGLGACADPNHVSEIKRSLLELIRQHHQGTLCAPDSSAVAKFDGRCQSILFHSALKQAIQTGKNHVTATVEPNQ